MTKIIILRGNSGSGKTTIAKMLQKRLGNGTMLISQDVVKREILYVKDEKKQIINDLLFKLAKFGKENWKKWAVLNPKCIIENADIIK